jgi:uncharacterized protein (DUF885 family)
LSTPQSNTNPVKRALDVAQELVDGHFRQFPEDAAGTGYPSAPLDRLGDSSLEALAEWEAREDAWLEELERIGPGVVAGTEAAVPYAVARERLEASIGRRSYRPELWNVSTAWGWPFALPVVFQRQPVGTDQARADALARARDVARFLDTEVENLREGLRLGFVQPRDNVLAVLAQVDELLESPVEVSPFYQPAVRDGDASFAASLRAIIEGDVCAALRRYGTFLRDAYVARAREGVVGVGSLPCGPDGYRASVRFHASISPLPEEIHETGLGEMERIETEMREIARRSFGTGDLRGLLQKLRSDGQYTFRTEQEVLSYNRAAIERAHAALPRWFGHVPDSRVEVRPFPAFQKRTGGGLYSAPSADGRQPGTYELGTHAPQKLARATQESTAFHETWPGHHLQISIAVESAGLHPILRYMFSSGFIEGWALYSERLADEMGLYSSDLDRLGLLSNEAMRAARLVVDPGLHVLGWSRERAIRYMLDHTTESEEAATYEVDRYISGPGQAVSYLLGRLELGRLRRLAEERFGAGFDIRAFHDLVLEDGSITLSVVRDKVEGWVSTGGVA